MGIIIIYRWLYTSSDHVKTSLPIFFFALEQHKNMRAPLLLQLARMLSGEADNESCCHVSATSKGGGGWIIGSAVGAGLGTAAGFYVASEIGFSDRWIGALTGLGLGLVGGYGVSLEMSGTTMVVLGVLGVLTIALGVFINSAMSVGLAAAPGLISAIPVEALA